MKVAMVRIGIDTGSGGIHGPLSSTWFNQRIDDPQVRATMFSVRGQFDAIGQIASGPVVGMVGNVSNWGGVGGLGGDPLTGVTALLDHNPAKRVGTHSVEAGLPGLATDKELIVGHLHY